MPTVPWLSIDTQGDIKSFWEVLHTRVKVIDLWLCLEVIQKKCVFFVAIKYQYSIRYVLQS